MPSQTSYAVVCEQFGTHRTDGNLWLIQVAAFAGNPHAAHGFPANRSDAMRFAARVALLGSGSDATIPDGRNDRHTEQHVPTASLERIESR
jgi:hypothetical protein